MREGTVYKEKRREKIQNCEGQPQNQRMLQAMKKLSLLHYNPNILINKP